MSKFHLITCCVCGIELGFTTDTVFNSEKLFCSSCVDAITILHNESVPASVGQPQPVIKSFILHQNYPNPFNSSTTIEFTLVRSAYVSLKIFNTLGQELTTLVSEKLPSGEYKHNWIASELSSGVYLYQLQVGDFVEIKKLVLLR